MSLRHVLWSWLAAFFLLFLGVWLVIRNAPPDPQALEGVDVAIIGSSLLAYAIPEAGAGEGSLFVNGQNHRRMAFSLISESESIRLGENALKAGAKVLMIEADPFIKGFKNGYPSSQCDGWSEQARGVVLRNIRQFSDDIWRSLGRKRYGTWLREPEDLHNSPAIKEGIFAKIYPLDLHEPKCGERLDTLAQKASVQGVKLILALPPRSQTAGDWIGDKQSAELRARAEQLADRLNASLFAPESSWPDDEFVDHAHLNIKGREHFLASLRQWQADLP